MRTNILKNFWFSGIITKKGDNMNLDKMVNSKWYGAFEWGYRLVFLNLLLITIPSLLGGAPFLIWYYHQSWGWLMIIAIVLMFIGFFPAYIAAFMVIKAYKEDKTGNLFGLFFSYFWDTFKRLYLLELIMLPFIALYSFGALIYWEILGNFDGFDFDGIVAIIGFVVLFFSLMAILLAFLQLPMIVANFRMKNYTLVKFSFFMAFRYFFKTLGYLLVLAIPLMLVSIFKSMVLPLYLLIGISGPLFVMYVTSRKQYWYLVNNLDDITTENDLEGDKK
jgi:uncharacterized membrane protein YesL